MDPSRKNKIIGDITESWSVFKPIGLILKGNKITGQIPNKGFITS